MAYVATAPTEYLAHSVCQIELVAHQIDNNTLPIIGHT